jgi:hypothetical protein
MTNTESIPIFYVYVHSHKPVESENREGKENIERLIEQECAAISDTTISAISFVFRKVKWVCRNN